MNKKTRLIAEDCVRVGDKIYFIAKNFNIIFNLELSSGNIGIVDSLPKERMLEDRLGAKIVSFGDYLYFAPMKAKKIWRYDISNAQWKSYELKHIADNEMPYYFMITVEYKDRLFFVGGNYPAIVVLDLKTEEISYIESPMNERMSVKKDAKDSFFRSDYVLKDNCMLLASCIKNEVLRLNLDTYEYEYLPVGESDYKYSGIGYDGQNYFLSPRGMKPAVLWDGKDGVELIGLKHMNVQRPFSTQGVLCKENKIIMGSWFVDESFFIEKYDGKYESNLLNECFWFYKKIDDNTYARLLNTGVIVIDEGKKHYEYDLEYDTRETCDWLVTEMNKRSEKMSDSRCVGDLIIEKTNIDLELFIRSI